MGSPPSRSSSAPPWRSSSAHSSGKSQVSNKERSFVIDFRIPALLSVYNELQWHRQSRSKVLHLLHQSDSGVQQIRFQCYEAPLFKFEPLSFSERFILMNCFYRFGKLRSLHLPNVCDDEILAFIGENGKKNKKNDIIALIFLAFETLHSCLKLLSHLWLVYTLLNC